MSKDRSQALQLPSNFGCNDLGLAHCVSRGWLRSNALPNTGSFSQPGFSWHDSDVRMQDSDCSLLHCMARKHSLSPANPVHLLNPTLNQPYKANAVLACSPSFRKPILGKRSLDCPEPLSTHQIGYIPISSKLFVECHCRETRISLGTTTETKATCTSNRLLLQTDRGQIPCVNRVNRL